MSIQSPAFFPVIHPVSREEALKSVATAVGCGADGVFLINQGMTVYDTLTLVMDVVRAYPTLPVGINILGDVPENAVPMAKTSGARMIWSDNAYPRNAYILHCFEVACEKAEWTGLYFGGVAFKYQPHVSNDKIAETIGDCRTVVDVITTSGERTGSPPDKAKIDAFRAALGPTGLLAVASGITPDNVDAYLDDVDAFLVATGIEKSFGVLDPDLTKALADKVRKHRTEKPNGRAISL